VVAPHEPSPDEVDVDDAEGTEGSSRMSFLEHLEELRKRILYSVYALLVGCGIAFFFAVDLTHYLQGYLTAMGGKLQYTELMGGFMFYFKVGAFAGLLLSAPVIFLQLWLFVAPGLYQRERRVVVPFVASSTALFASGVYFAHRFAIPSMLKFFASFENQFVDMRPNISSTFDFYVKMILAFGLVFQMPILVFFLARFGIVTARFMWKHFRYAVLIIFVVAAIATPSADPVNQAMFAAPMVVLYLISIVVAWVFQKRTKKGDDDDKE
jgi:sec-independent protein translocase protein TatC